MYRTAEGDEIFIIDGQTRAGAPFALVDVDMGVGGLSPEDAPGGAPPREQLIFTGLCLPDAQGRPEWDIAALRRLRQAWGIRGVTIMPPRWQADSRAYHLYTPEGFRYLAECERLGICNIHLFPAEGATLPDRASYDLEDLERAASSFPGLNFIVEHAGLPWLEDFCWIATRELNVYAGMGRLMPFLRSKPRYFAELLAELLFWLGPDRLIFGGDEGESPRELVAAFLAFALPADLSAEYRIGLSLEVKRQILGENLAQLYGLRLPR